MCAKTYLELHIGLILLEKREVKTIDNYLLSSGQTIKTFQHTISQHCEKSSDQHDTNVEQSCGEILRSFVRGSYKFRRPKPKTSTLGLLHCQGLHCQETLRFLLTITKFSQYCPLSWPIRYIQIQGT